MKEKKYLLLLIIFSFMFLGISDVNAQTLTELGVNVDFLKNAKVGDNVTLADTLTGDNAQYFEIIESVWYSYENHGDMRMIPDDTILFKSSLESTNTERDGEKEDNITLKYVANPVYRIGRNNFSIEAKIKDEYADQYEAGENINNEFELTLSDEEIDGWAYLSNDGVVHINFQIILENKDVVQNKTVSLRLLDGQSLEFSQDSVRDSDGTILTYLFDLSKYSFDQYINYLNMFGDEDDDYPKTYKEAVAYEFDDWNIMIYSYKDEYEETQYDWDWVNDEYPLSENATPIIKIEFTGKFSEEGFAIFKASPMVESDTFVELTCAELEDVPVYHDFADLTLFENLLIKVRYGKSTVYGFLDNTETQTFTLGSSGELKFRADVDFSKFENVYLDGVLVSPNNYTAKSGSTIVILNPSFVNTLSAGNHTLVMNFTDGYATATFTINDTPLPPKTFDGIVNYIGLGLISIIGLLGSALYLRKREN